MIALKTPNECALFAQIVDPYVDGELEPGHAASVEVHVSGCEACKERVELALALKKSLKRTALRKARPVPEGLRLRVAAAIEGSGTSVRKAKDRPEEPIRETPGGMPKTSAMAVAALAGFLCAMGVSRVREAFRLAEEEKPGAVHIEFPEDIADAHHRFSLEQAPPPRARPSSRRDGSRSPSGACRLRAPMSRKRKRKPPRKSGPVSAPREHIHSFRLRMELTSLELASGHDGLLRGMPEPVVLLGAFLLADGRALPLGRCLVRLSSPSGRFPTTVTPPEPAVLRAKGRAISSARIAVLALAVEEDDGGDVERIYAHLAEAKNLRVWDLEESVPSPASLAELLSGSEAHGVPVAATPLLPHPVVTRVGAGDPDRFV